MDGDPIPGVRWALSTDGTGFGSSVLTPTPLAAGTVGVHSTKVTFPNEVGTRVLQFNWATENDGPTGGSYVGCADITLVANANDLDDDNASPDSNSNGDGDDGANPGSGGMSGGSAFLVTMLVLGSVYVGAGFGYSYHTKQEMTHPHSAQWKHFGTLCAEGASATLAKIKGEAPPPPVPTKSSYTAAPAETGGEVGALSNPVSAAPPPPQRASRPAAPALPAGWQAHWDQESSEYYFEGPEGQTVWEAPTC